MTLIVADMYRDNLDRTDGCRANLIGMYLKGFRGDRLADVHRVERPCGKLRFRQVNRQLAVFCNNVAVDEHAGDTDVFFVINKYDVRALARGDGAELVIHLEALCAVERDHLDSGDKIDAEGDGTTHDVVEMTVCNQRMRVGIIGNHGRKSAVHFVLRDGLGDLLQIVPSGALAQHGIHAETHFCECVLRTGGFMTAAHAACNVCIEAATRLRDGIVTCDDFAGFQRFAGDVVRRLRGSGDARKVHHFA